VEDPLGRPIEAHFALTPPGRRGATAIVESSAASGLHLIPERERDPVTASTFGTGQLVAAAFAAGARTVLVAAGGSATTDGGAGAIKALRAAGGVPKGAQLVVLSDVRTAFEDAARVFGPQKGATPEQVRSLTRRLHGLARRWGPRDPRGVPLTGASGGLAGGLWAEFDAELIAGAAYVLDAIGFDHRLRRARAVVSGEGRLDEQSLAGKTLSEVATRARQTGVPCYAIVGASALDRFGLRILDLQAVLEARTASELEAAGRRLAGLI
jgi:glycerate kinase